MYMFGFILYKERERREAQRKGKERKERDSNDISKGAKNHSASLTDLKKRNQRTVNPHGHKVANIIVLKACYSHCKKI